ncbi:CHASE3 domain-containing protein [Gelidibacter japonicus]|uniref:CHASE3 domain-containing protein n=1 Tax=Gelidibacter japonicus TaxID=1962232 RepID=UPI002020ABE0|nr:CHASE3 domain-containing protein [Gelidibacter japonicus]MCL8008771.1 CHASE3 domain-containing protein [Gelidibacter japonicus]
MKFKSIFNSERILKIIFGLSLFVVLVMGGMSYQLIKKLSKSFEDVQHTYQMHIELEKLLSALKDAESGKRAFIISQDSTFLEPLLSSQSELDNSLERLKLLTKNNPAQQKNIAELKIKIDKNLEIFEKTLSLAIANKTDSPEFISSFKEGRQTMNSVRFKIMDMTTHESEELGIRKEKSSKTLSNAPMLIYYALIFSLLILLLTYLQISKNLRILKEKNELLETFKESTTQSEIISKHGNWIWYIEDNTFEYSDNLYRLLGEEPQSFPATLENFMGFVHPDDLDKLTEQVNKMMENEDLPFIHYRIIQKNGSIKHFKAYGKVLIDSDGHKKLLGTTADITDEIENYRLIEERNLELERNNKELASFNYVASHDLQEPLRKIQTFISRLEDKEKANLSDNGKLYITRIKSSSARMRSLIDDLLQFSRTNKSEEAFEDSNINILLETAKHDLAEIISDKRARISSDSIPSMKVIPFQIKQLFLNLISNSLKYSRENVAPVITIGYSQTQASDLPKIKFSKHDLYHTISIKDNGIGFDQEYAEKIFILFNRLHNKNEYSGTGIGLSICKKIVENHNGYITAEGKLDQGSVFTVYLPITT